MAKMSAKAHAEHGLDLGEQVPEARVRPTLVRQPREERHRERMKDRHREQQGGDDFDGLGHGWASVIRDDDCALPA